MTDSSILRTDAPICAAVIVAAGRGVRAGGSLPKQYQSINNKPLLRHTVEAFHTHRAFSQILCVIHPDDEERFHQTMQGLEGLAWVHGGSTRQESVRLGLKGLGTVNPRATPTKVLIHDAARCFVSHALIERILEALDTHRAVVPSLPIHDTLRHRPNTMEAAVVVPRQEYHRAQTPQGFDYQALCRAHEQAVGADMSDDGMVMEAAGEQVMLVRGEERNIKITTTADMERESQGQGQGQRQASIPSYRTGSGLDVHRFGEAVANGVIRLMGVDIPHARPLVGHSDADVGLHAVTDAILGAVGADDIGTHFPPSDARWKGSRSTLFLEHALSLMHAQGFFLVCVDTTIICEMPKITPHRTRLRTRLATLCNLSPKNVNIKATTTEGLGFTGRGEGICVMAQVTVAR